MKTLCLLIGLFMLGVFARPGQASAQSVTRVVVSATAAPVLVRPDPAMTPLRAAREGSVLNVIADEGAWYRIEFQDPQFGRRVGYIEKRHVSVSGSATVTRTGEATPTEPRNPPARTSASVSVVGAADERVARFQVTAMLVDTELNVKPVPRHALVLRPTAGNVSRLVTGLDGKSEITISAGAYVLESERAVDFQGKSYKWALHIDLEAGKTSALELSVDNAVVETVANASVTTAALPVLFRRWQSSVVTVWSDTGHGSGFVIDKRGLIVTNQHVIGVSEYAAIQFSETLKVPARILASSAERDIAILLVNPQYVSEIEPVSLGYAANGSAPAVEGEQVFTIGSPLHQRKIMTSGIVSKIEPTVIMSDVNINHGNSGGPLFTTNGVVIGVTTFGDFTDQGGPGVSGIVRIDEARDLIANAMADVANPPAESTLPVEPLLAYPVESLKEVLSAKPVKASDYLFGTGDFQVAVITPMLTYGLRDASEKAAMKERGKRNRNAQSVQGTTTSELAQYKNWAEYVGEFRPVIHIAATPKLVEGFLSGLSRGLAATQGVYVSANVHFKSDFYRMRLMCGEKEVTPIHPGKIEHRVQARTAAINVNDTSFEGFYTFGPDAITPQCGTVTLTFYTEKEPDKGKVHVLSSRMVQKIWEDFAPYRQASEPGRVTP